MGNAFRVGLVTVLFAGLLLAAYAVLGRSFFAEKTYPIHADFADAAGVASGAQVLYAGVKIGQVSEVKLLNGKARVTMAIREGVQLPSNAQASLPMSLIGIGDRQIEISAPKPSGQLSANAVLPGSLKSPLDAFAPGSGKTLEEVNKTLIAMRRLMEDQSLKQGLVDVMKQGQQTAAQFGGLAARLDTLIAQNQGVLASTLRQANKAMANGAALAGDMRSVSRELARFVASGKLQNGADALLTKLNTTLDMGNGLLADLRAAANNPQTKEQLEQMLKNARSMTDSGVKIGQNVEILTQKGTVLADEVVTISKKASIFADEATELVRALKKKVEDLPGSIPGLGGGAGIGKVETTTDLYREMNPNHWRIDLGAKIGMKDRNLHLGLYDAFESNKINAQMGIPLNKKTEARLGMYAGKVGIGVDYSFAPGLRLRSDLFDLNKPQLNVKANFPIRPGVNGWIGVERLFGRNSPTIGLGIRK